MSRRGTAALLTSVATLLVVWLVLGHASWGPPALGGVLVSLAAWRLLRVGEGGHSSALIGAAVGLLLCGVAPLTFLAFTPSADSHAWVVALVVAIAAGGRVAWIIGVGQQRLVEAIVWIFIYVFLGLAPVVQLRERIDPETTPYIDHALDARALTVVVVGIAALVGGLVCARRSRRPRERQVGRPVRGSRAAALAAFGLACSVYFVVSVGPSALLSSREQLDLVAASVWPDPTTTAIVRALAIMPLLVAFVALRLQADRKSNVGWADKWLLPWVTGAVLLFVANPISNARYTSGTVYLAVLAAMGLVATRASFRAMCAAFVASLILLFPLADAYRYTTTATFKASDPVSALTTGDFDAFAQIVNTVQYVQVHGVTYGYQALGPLVFWVPRSAWPGKPIDTGILLANSRGYTFTNLSAPLWAELFINGGWIALALGMLAFGFLVGRWDDGIVAVLARARTPGLLACILPFYLLILLRGSLLQATAALAVVLVCGRFVRDSRPGRDLDEYRTVRLSGVGGGPP